MVKQISRDASIVKFRAQFLMGLLMRYLIQYFRSEPMSNVGSWRNTAFGGNDLNKVKNVATSIAEENKIKVRVLEVLLELDCKSPSTQRMKP